MKTGAAAESAAFVAKEARESVRGGGAPVRRALAEIEATRDSRERARGGGAAAAAAARQRLTLASHEVDAETAGSERKWESLREKAVQATRALETELRALG